jgi:hypothetical protein
MAERAISMGRSPDRQLRLIQIGWMLLFVLVLTMNVINVPYIYREQLANPSTEAFPVPDSESLRVLLHEAGITLTQHAIYTVLVRQIVAFLSLGTALLIFAKRSADCGALMVSLLLMTQAPAADTSQFPYITKLLGTPVVAQVLYVIGASSFILFYVFPNGRFVPRWTRWVALAFVAVFVLEAFTPFSISDSVWLYPVGVAGILTSIYAQIFRYRNVSGTTERKQTRWAMLGLVMTPVAWLLSGLSLALFPFLREVSAEGLRASMIGQLIMLPLYAMGPIGVAVALLLYRLYDVDVVIRRTLTYSIITALLAGVYFGVVTLLQSTFVHITGQESPLAMVISTLAITALFNPLRRRVQDVVDRHFNRIKYDAEKTLEAFAETMRDELDMDHLSAALVGVVEETMQPEQASLWLPPSLKNP